MTHMRSAEVSVSAVKQNVRQILATTNNASLIAVVKANGYGHGAKIVAEAALEAGASIIGVTDLREAFALRDAGITAPILSWLHGPDVDFRSAVSADIQIGITRLDQIYTLAEIASELDVKPRVHLKVDTGLSRGGLAPTVWNEAFEKCAELQKAAKLEVVGIFSHLSNAGNEEDLQQAKIFEKAIETAKLMGIEPQMLHLASSAAVFTSPHLHFNAVRVGLAIYGLSPFEDKSSAELGLRPAMTLKAQIISRRTIASGVGVSYGYLFRAEAETQLALVPVGYADGLPRLLNTDTITATVRGTQCNIVGRIAMDQCVIDLTPLGDAAEAIAVGEQVTLFGDPQSGVTSVDDWARNMQTINYEIVARLGGRIEQVPVA